MTQVVSPPSRTHEDSVSLDGGSLARLLGAPAELELVHVELALGRADFDDAAARCLARARLGLALPAELIGRVMVGVSQGQIFVSLGRAAGAEVAPYLEEAVRRKRYGFDAVGVQQLCLAALLLESFGRLDAARATLLPQLRTAARKPWLGLWTREILRDVARRIGDVHLSALCEQFLEPAAVPLPSSLIDEMLKATPEEVINGLRASAPALVLPGVPMRVAPKVGRNDPCLCGSGRKYKKCCEASGGTQRSISYAQQLHDLAPHLTYAQIGRFSRKHLAMLDPQRLTSKALVALMREWAGHREYRRAAQVVGELAVRDASDASGHAEDLLRDAIHDGCAAEVMPLLGPLLELDADLRLKLALAAEPTLGAELERVALDALRADPREGAEIELAFTLLDARPALGILVARGTLWAERAMDAETLVDSIEDARDTLLLPPGDRARATFDALGGEPKAHAERETERAAHGALATTAADLQQRLSSATGRIAQLQRQVAESERALQSASAKDTSLHMPAPSAAPEQLARLHGKVDELKGLLRERNAERAELRRQLEEAAQEAPRSDPKRRAPSDEEDPLEAAYDAPLGRTVLVPRFPTAFEAELGRLPRHVAADAMRTAGALASGDPASWRGVKQAKNMRRPVLMARVGIHHRLVFLVEQGALEVTHLIARAELEQVLQRLRG
ncbi:MAG TPA: SEC-C metal-binding domain-containing protein [Polyangiales bacterium]|nr:SEC-C metal-binding domain-containing protein [Polyangiales bacterium]